MSDEMRDLAQSISRSLTTGSRDGTETRSVTVSREFASPCAEVWDAITKPERISAWMTPVTGELKLGGRYQLEGNAGGTITVCEHEKRFEITWEYAGAVGWVNVELESLDANRTRLTLTHTDHVYEDFWKQYGPGATGVGWELSLLGLTWHVESGIDRPPETDGWESGPDGLAFIGSCTTAWAAVSEAWGTPADEAAEAAANTKAFYTGTLRGASGDDEEEGKG